MKLNFLLHRVGPLWYNGAIEEMARSRIGQRGADHVGEIYPKSSCTLDAWVEHIVHIDGVTGSSPVATTKIPGNTAFLGISLYRAGAKITL